MHMVEKEIFGSGLAVKGDEAPQSYHVAYRSENAVLRTPTASATPPVTATAPAVVPSASAPAAASAVAAVSVSITPGTVEKKRGRPRKYAADGSMAFALCPMPISSSIPLSGEFSAWKRGRGRPMEPIKKIFNCEFETPGERISYSVGANFTPHMITVNAGEDVTMKIMSFSRQGSRAICILSANGTISNVTLRQPTTSGGTVTYEGRFEILSLSGSFIPTENGITKSRSGGMSVSLACPDGRVLGGGLAGLLVAAGHVQIVVACFLPGHHHEQKPKKERPKKQRPETTSVMTSLITTIPAIEANGVFGGIKPIVTPTAFHADNPSPFNNVQIFRTSSADTKTSLPEDQSKDQSQSNCELSY